MGKLHPSTYPSHPRHPPPPTTAISNTPLPLSHLLQFIEIYARQTLGFSHTNWDVEKGSQVIRFLLEVIKRGSGYKSDHPDYLLHTGLTLLVLVLAHWLCSQVLLRYSSDKW